MTNPGPLDERRNLIAFVCGVKGSGKSELMHRAFTAPTPRVLTLEFARWETTARDPSAVRALGLAGTLRALERCAAYAEWHVVAALDEEDVPALFRVLCPPLSSGHDGYSVAVGGMAVACAECDLIAPIAHTDPIVRGAWKRGRHYQLSLYMGTQRPHECARIVTSQADHVITFAQYEPRDIRYMADNLSTAIAERIPRLPRYWCLWYERATGIVYVRDASYRTVEAFPLYPSNLSLWSDADAGSHFDHAPSGEMARGGREGTRVRTPRESPGRARPSVRDQSGGRTDDAPGGGPLASTPDPVTPAQD